jgi:LCP family protein required for cell wall assembly
MKKKLILSIGFILLVVIGLIVFKFHEFYSFIYQKKSNGFLQKLIEEKSVYSFLLLGYGGIDKTGKPHDGTYLTDTMMVLRLDTKLKKVLLISLPRDIWVKLPTNSGADFHEKINAVYQIAQFYKDYPDLAKTYKTEGGAGELTKLIVQNIVGFPIDYYMTVDFEGFKNAVDILGGVDVDVQKTFDDYQYPIEGKEKELCGKDEDFNQIKDFINPPYNGEERLKLFKEKPALEEFVRQATEEPNLAFPCRYEKLHFDAGLTHMDGETALKYVRSRHSLQDGNDFGRAARQQNFLQAVKNKVINIGFIPKIIPLLDEMKTRIKTDIPIDVMKQLFGESRYSESYKMQSIVLTDSDYLKSSVSSYGGYILIPKEGIDKWDVVHSYINNIIKGITPTPTKTASQEAELRNK